jgi:Cu/Ag efflux pump CusA
VHPIGLWSHAWNVWPSNKLGGWLFVVWILNTNRPPAGHQGGVRRRHIFRQANFISVAIDNLLAALRDGALLVVLIVLAFFASGRATAITVLAIPLSCLTTIVAMKVFGPDLYELRRVASRVRQAMQDVPGVVDLAVEQQADIPFVTVKLKRAMIARYGLRVRDVAEAVETAFAGHVVSRVLEGEAAFDLAVRYAPSVLGSLEAIRSTLITLLGWPLLNTPPTP